MFGFLFYLVLCKYLQKPVISCIFPPRSSVGTGLWVAWELSSGTFPGHSPFHTVRGTARCFLRSQLVPKHSKPQTLLHYSGGLHKPNLIPVSKEELGSPHLGGFCRRRGVWCTRLQCGGEPPGTRTQEGKQWGSGGENPWVA